MGEIRIVALHELRAFLKSGLSALLLLAFTTILWGGVIAGKVETIDEATSFLWVIFFALVGGAGATNSVFIRERLSGTFEILLTAGLERSAILIGKLVFTTSVTLLVGMGAFGFGFLTHTLIYKGDYFSIDQLLSSLLLYGAAALLMSSSSAYLSLSLSNPRMVQFVNFILLTFCSMGFTLVGYIVETPLSLWWLALFMGLLSLLFDYMALKLFRSEKVLQPLIY